MIMTRLRLLAACVILLGGCTELERNNPLDPEMAVMVELTGPDTVRYTGETFTIHVNITPAWPNAPVEWDYPAGPLGTTFTPTSRTFTMPPGSGWPMHWVVKVNAGPHEATLAVPMDQKVTRIGFTPCPFIGCVAQLDAFESSPRFVGVRYFDAGNAPIYNLDRIPESIFAAVVVRDESVMQRIAVNSEGIVLYPMSQGKTWVVAPGFGTDSIAVYADYVLESLETTCPATIAVGATVSMTVTGKSADGISILRPLVLDWNVQNDYANGEISMTTPGHLTGVSPGLVRVTVSEGAPRIECIIEVVP